MPEDKRNFVEWLRQAVKLPRPDQGGNGREPIANPFGIGPEPFPDPFYDPDTQRRIAELISQIAVQPKKVRRRLFPPGKKRVGY